MVGYCHLRQDMRTSRLDRVVNVRLCDQTFTRPAQIDIMRHVEASIARTPGAWRIDVLLQTTLENAQQQISPALATLEATAEGIRMCCLCAKASLVCAFPGRARLRHYCTPPAGITR